MQVVVPALLSVMVVLQVTVTAVLDAVPSCYGESLLQVLCIEV